MHNIFYLIFGLLLFSFVIAAVSLAPWVPTRRKDLKRVQRLADLKEGDIFYELGCGTGGVSNYISKHTPATVIGIEFALPMYLVCIIRNFIKPRKNLTYKLKSLYQENLQPANVIYVFGMENKMKSKFSKKLKEDLRPGTRVISYCFKINGWQHKLVDRPSNNDLPIYLYEI